MIRRRADNELGRDQHIFFCLARDRQIESDVFADIRFVARTIRAKTIVRRVVDTKAVERREAAEGVSDRHSLLVFVNLLLVELKVSERRSLCAR